MNELYEQLPTEERATIDVHQIVITANQVIVNRYRNLEIYVNDIAKKEEERKVSHC